MTKAAKHIWKHLDRSLTVTDRVGLKPQQSIRAARKCIGAENVFDPSQQPFSSYKPLQLRLFDAMNPSDRVCLSHSASQFALNLKPWNYSFLKVQSDYSLIFKAKYKQTIGWELLNYSHFLPRFVTRRPVRGGDRSLSPRIRPLSAWLKVRAFWPQLQVSDSFGGRQRLRSQRSHQQAKRSKAWHFSGTRRRETVNSTRQSRVLTIWVRFLSSIILLWLLCFLTTSNFQRVWRFTQFKIILTLIAVSLFTSYLYKVLVLVSLPLQLLECWL